MGILGLDEIMMEAWYDDWEVNGALISVLNAQETVFGDDYAHSVLVMNYGGNNPNDPMAIEIDNFEVWDCLPS